jgi:hypothetical protein
MTNARTKLLIYWDTSDPQDNGWAYQYWGYDDAGYMSNVDSGGLSNTNFEASDKELLEEGKTLGYTFDEFEIVRQ